VVQDKSQQVLTQVQVVQHFSAFCLFLFQRSKAYEEE